MTTQPPPYQGGFGPPQQPQPQPPAQPQSQPPYGQAAPPPYGPYAPQVPPQPPGPGWGGPPMGPPPGPPKSSNGAKVAGIVLGSVLGLVVLVGGSILALSSDGSTSDTAAGYDGPTYTIELPATLLDGEYTRGQDITDKLEASRPADGGPYADQVEYGGAFYSTASGDTKLLVTGLSSAMENPDYPRHSILDGMEDNPSATVEVPRQEFTPVPGEDPLKCEVLSKDQQGMHLVFPVCSWVDPHTQATVARTGVRSASQRAEEIDLAAFAKTVAKVRDEVRVPAGS